MAGAKRVRIRNFEEGIGIKDYGEENRKYRETVFNEFSSRSHCIFQIYIESILEQNKYNKNTFSCLNLVDLAGSERINDYDSKKNYTGETGYINKSLFVLTNVINKLAENSKKKNYVPYRDSKLTRLLSQSLGGNSLTTIICNVSPAAMNYNETVSTLRFASRAKTIKLNVSVNEYIDDKERIEFYKNEIRKLKEQINNNNAKNIIRNNYNNIGEYNSQTNGISRDEYNNMINAYQSLTKELENYKKLYINEKIKSENYKKQIYNNKYIRNNEIINEQNEYNENNNIRNYNNNEKIENIIKNNDVRNAEIFKLYEEFKAKKKHNNQNNSNRNNVDQLYQKIIIDNFNNEPLNLNYNNILNFNNNNFNQNYNNYISQLPNQNIIANTINNINKNRNIINTNKNENSKYFDNMYLKHSKSKDKNLHEIDDRILSEIYSEKIFDSNDLKYIIDKNNEKNNEIEIVQNLYKIKKNALDKSMNYYKSYVDGYFKGKINEIESQQNINNNKNELLIDMKDKLYYSMNKLESLYSQKKDELLKDLNNIIEEISNN